jgi:hypothetical protein
MIRLPLDCSNCGEAFDSDLYVHPGTHSVQVSGSLAGEAACPRCGARSANTGKWRILRQAGTDLIGEDRQVLGILHQQLSDATDAGDADGVLDALDQVGVLAGIRGVLAGQGNRNEILAWASILLAVLTLLITIAPTEKDELTPELVQEVVSEALKADREARSSTGKHRRNGPCWCGSQKKFKRCHWVDQRK